MKKFIKNLLLKLSDKNLDKLVNFSLYLYRVIISIYYEKMRRNNNPILLNKWNVNGIPSIHTFKIDLINRIKQKLNYKIFIETGAYQGDMIEAQKRNFEKIYSVELLPNFYEKVKRRFLAHEHIQILQGNSGVMLESLLQNIEEPCIFWLDAHLQIGKPLGVDIDAPVKKELEAILAHPYPHVVLIDDARYFNGSMNYPTIDEIEIAFRKKNKSYNVHVEGDVIVVDFPVVTSELRNSEKLNSTAT